MPYTDLNVTSYDDTPLYPLALFEIFAAKVRHNILIMVLLLDVNPEVGAHVQSELGILFCCIFFLDWDRSRNFEIFAN